jgi:hypothetical protein
MNLKKEEKSEGANGSDQAIAAIPAFTKQQFLASKQRADQKDLLNALLVDGQTYNNDQVDGIISEFLGKAVE